MFVLPSHIVNIKSKLEVKTHRVLNIPLKYSRINLCHSAPSNDRVYCCPPERCVFNKA